MTYRATFQSSVFLSVIASMVLLLTGCGGEAQRSSEAGVATEGQAAAESAGTLVLDKTSYQVHVRSCRLEGDTDENRPTLRGTVARPDGKRLTITVERRSRPGGHIAHSVFLMGEGQQWTAERERIGGRWTKSSLFGTPMADRVPDESLVHVRGDTVIAEGLFESSGDEYVEGRLSVTCP